MYPFKSDVFALKNAWYVAAFSREVGREILSRWILDKSVILYRTEAGEPVAMNGRCPHRHFPLGKGYLEGDSVVCAYHGLRFGSDGHCEKIPTQPRVAKTYCNQAYPVVERYKYIWIWTGDPALADEALLPRHPALELLDDPAATADAIHYEHVKGRYMLMHDNLFDLSHLSYLHATSIGTPEFAETPEDLDSGPGWTQCTRHVQERETRLALGDVTLDSNATYTGPSVRVTSMKFIAPAIHVGYDGVHYPDDHPDRAGESMREAQVYHAVTPATKTSTHYFFSQALTKTAGDPAAVLESLREVIVSVLMEDKLATEEIENMVQAYGDDLPREKLTKGDTNCVRARRMLETMIKEEQAAQLVKTG